MLHSDHEGAEVVVSGSIVSEAVVSGFEVKVSGGHGFDSRARMVVSGSGVVDSIS